jgi:hypothetical protein
MTQQKQMTMRLWLDDERPAPSGWIHAKTAAGAQRLLETGRVVELSLDHDLGPLSAGTGYDVVCWLEEQCARQDFIPPEIISVHSANPVGAQRMHQAIESIRRVWQQKVGGS